MFSVLGMGFRYEFQVNAQDSEKPKGDQAYIYFSLTSLN